MVSITIRIPDELHKEMKRMSWINWSQFIIKSIRDFIFKSKNAWSIEDWRKYFGIEPKDSIDIENYEKIRKEKEKRIKLLKEIEEKKRK